MQSAFMFIYACLVYAYYSHVSIKVGTNNWQWHAAQWISAFLFIIAGFCFGFWWKNDFSFHIFGDIVAVAVLGVSGYIWFLHWLNRRYDG